MTELGKNISLSGQCFPVRSLTRHAAHTENVGGAWLVAYKAEQRRRFKAVLSRDPDVVLPGKPSAIAKPNTTSEEETRKKLDGFYLMNLLHVNDPLDLCTINISGKGLSKVNEEDFSLFKNVLYIDAGENNLQLKNFVGFPSLRELELPLNGVRGELNVTEHDFIALELLDLSCNNLTNDDILALSRLPALKVLHLSGNHLSELPVEMSKSYQVVSGHRKARFSKLEKLWLDQNNLTERNTFSRLAGLKRLKYLNLEHNQICGVPHLKLVERRPNDDMNNQYDNFPLTENAQSVDDDLQLRNNVDEILDSELQHVAEKISTLENILYNDEKQTNTSNNVRHDETFVQFQDTDQAVPFLALEHLNLANNCVEEEEGLLALSTWPTLRELVIWGNPVASCSKDGPAIVSYHLGHIAGIHVTRHKPSPVKQKNMASLKLGKNPRRVHDLPPVSYTKRLLMLDAPNYPEISRGELPPLPPITADSATTAGQIPLSRQGRSSSAPATDVRTSHSPQTARNDQQESGDSRQPADLSSEERVFLTQVDENDEVLFINDNEPPPTTETLVTNLENVPLKYQGYEELLNIDENCHDDVQLPKDIHGNVRALQYTLDHPLIFTDQSTKPRARKKHKEMATAPTHKTSRPTTTVEELSVILDKMRTHSNTVEKNLGDVLNDSMSTRRKKESKEARTLLNEVQTKYNEVRCESLRSTNIAVKMLPQPLSEQHDVRKKDSRSSDRTKSTKDLPKRTP